MGKHKITTDDIQSLQGQITGLKMTQAKRDNEFTQARQDVLKALNDMNGRLKELSERISDRDSDKAEYAQPEMASIPNEYQRAEMLRMAANANLHPDQIVPTAQKFLAFVSGETASVQESAESRAARDLKFGVSVKRDFVNDLLDDYADLSDSASVNVGRVREVLRRAAGLS